MKDAMINDINNVVEFDFFSELSHKVIDLIAHVRVILFQLDAKAAVKAMTLCNQLCIELRKAEADCNDCLLVGISSDAERYHIVGCAQRCSRLLRVVNQVSVVVQGVQDLSGRIDVQDIEKLKSIYLIAEVELKDAVLSIIREDEKLAYSVRQKDKELDALYQKEMERIFKGATDELSYNFQTATSLLFILRAIERIGDHAKNLAVPSFFMLAPGR